MTFADPARLHNERLTMTTQQLSYFGTLVVTSCWCGIHLAIPASLEKEAQEGRSKIHCPIGHEFVYGETESDKLRKRLEMAERREANQRERAEAVERRLIAARGQITKAKNRAAAGACPVDGCHRIVTQMARHLLTKHPDFVEQHASANTTKARA